MGPNQVVLHVDMDAFYASVEARDEPQYQGRPLIVGADPRQGRGRGVVCTASYEARAYGIRSAMPISQAWRLAPHAVYVRPNFPRYHAESKAVMRILERYADELELVGLDEAYLDVTSRCLQDGRIDWDMAASLARSLQAAVARERRLSCSVGIGSSKSVAKIASDYRKPHGVTRIRPDEEAEKLRDLPANRLHGCGPKTAAALREMDIHTIGHLANTSLSSLQARFGSHGVWLHRLANGMDDRRVQAQRGSRKSRGNETTFLRNEKDPAAVQRVAQQLLAELLDDVSRTAATVTVKIRYGDYVTRTRSKTVPHGVHGLGARRIAACLVESMLHSLLDGRPVRLVGVRLSNFADAQPSLEAFGFEGLAYPHAHAAGVSTVTHKWMPLDAFHACQASQS